MPGSVMSALGVIADIEGTVLSAADRDFLLQPELSGLILFSRNYESPQQLRQLSAEIRALRPDLLLCVDQEGGRVQRFKTGFSRLPAMMALEAAYRDDASAAEQRAEQLGWLMAAEVRAQGVHLSFAPVLDIERDRSRVIGDRAFAHDAATVIRLAGAFVRGMQSAGMAAVGKHFPGHGAVVADSHVDLPRDPRPLAELEYDMRPFRELMDAGLLAGIMPAHVIYDAVDAQNTAGFSAHWLQDILRRQLGFGGIIFSDDLTMAGAASAGGYAARAVAAARAGANALVVCNNPAGAQQVVDAVRREHEAGQHQPLDLSFLQGDLPGAAVEQQIAAQRAALGLALYS
ncbi:MAG: beta-N-acetylhexosaminidase [Pseudomonadota bacterium]|nr:beta-N-acetylhexosaminidase [Pseudomonadota bacterium]